MKVCPSCANEISESAKFCPKCGTSLATADAATIDRAAEAPDDATLQKPSTDRKGVSRATSHSSDSLPHGRFLPGMMIGDRYRIVSILGRGGMGEVYRADDLSLGQQVALKFLPAELVRDPERLERFRQEVRIARQVSHPNVCRVYDIGVIEDEHFISMEYVEGEDLGHLLRRIGQLPEGKAIQISQQIAAGLAAAHDRNLVHRDLKPANIMLDERGIVRITDFGLAASVDQLEVGTTREGTPQYMAPEQLEGKGLTPRSDIYSLGLVLYELFTGKRAFDASTLSELIRVREESDLSSLSPALSGTDAAVERVILRCLEHDPERRPPSALAVAAALPGGDPLAAAIAAGETPSPEMVAAAGGERGLTTRAAAALLVTAIASLVILPFLSQWSGAALPMTIEHGPQVMKAKAREVLERLGYSEDPVDTAWGYFSMSGWLDHIEDSVEARDRWTHLEDREHPLFGFWYRESPALLVNTRYFTGVAGGVVSYSSPYPRRTDEARITIDDRGRLWSLSAVPPQVSTEEPGESPAIDPFERLLTEAGLETQDLRPVKPEWNPPFFADRRKAWITELEPGLEMRVEAAAYGDRPVYLARIFPWSEPLRMRSSSASLSQTVVNAIQIAIFLLVLLGAVLMARRNIRKGRGDPSGAFRLAVFVGLSVMVLWVLNADHVPSFSEFGLLVIALSWSLFFGFIFWIVYVALEPYIRRRWPDMLISWSRLASGQFRDPLVGRDLLVGGAAAILISIAIPHFIYFGHRLLGNPLPQPRLFGLPLVEGPFSAVVTILSQIPGAIAASFFVTFLLFVFLVLFKREWLAAASAILLGSAVSTLSSGGDWLAAILFTAVWTAIVLILVRFGMLAAIITIFTTNATGLASTVPGGFSSLTTWPILISLGTALIIVVVGFVFATQGRSLFPPDFLES